MLKTTLQVCALTLGVICLDTFSVVLAFPYFWRQPQMPPGGWQRGGIREPEWLDILAKRLTKAKSVTQPGPEIEFLYSRASELLERAKLARENHFQFGRLVGATNALLDASDRILESRKADLFQGGDQRGAALALQRHYFRVRQADYFAGLSGEKDSKQFVKSSRSLYQQARGAYDAREYWRAMLLGDASSLIVFALESIAQATIQVPEPPVLK